MNQAMRVFAILTAIVATISCGCKKQAEQEADQAQPEQQAPSDTKAREAATPQQALMEFAEAMAGDDKERMMAAMLTDDPEFTEAGFEGIIATRRFTERFVKAFGDAKAGMVAPMRVLPGIPSPQQVGKEWQTRKLREDRAIAEIKHEGLEASLELARHDGVWKVDTRKPAPPASVRDSELKKVRAMIEAFRESEKLIGTDGATPEDVLMDLGKRIQAIHAPR